MRSGLSSIRRPPSKRDRSSWKWRISARSGRLSIPLARLGFNELTQILQVLRGELESTDDGTGLYFREGSNKRVVLRHMVEPVCGYSLELMDDQISGRRFNILLTNADALGICDAIAGAMVWVAFGDPHAPCRCAERRAE